MCFRPAAMSAGPVECPKCGAKVDSSASKCPSCGAIAAPSMPGVLGAPGMPGAPGVPVAPGVPKAPGTPGK